jgi:hypothetical protein
MGAGPFLLQATPYNGMFGTYYGALRTDNT